LAEPLYAGPDSFSAIFLLFGPDHILMRNGRKAGAQHRPERGKQMPQKHNREYAPETDYRSDSWAEETYSLEDREPSPWRGRGPVARGGGGPHQLAARGFAQTFGLQPAMAFLTVVADTMIFAGDVASSGFLLPVAAGAGVVLGVITFLAQRKYFGDDKECALIKGLIVALLTAIPSPLPYALFLPAGVVGFFRSKK
jgi:hypothetical protein